MQQHSLWCIWAPLPPYILGYARGKLGLTMRIPQITPGGALFSLFCVFFWGAWITYLKSLLHTIRRHQQVWWWS